VPLLRALLQEADLLPRELDLVACATGPGSFTGIRIGIATAATLAWACGLPVLGVGSLHGIAANAPPGADDVLVALDARRGRVFAARFRGGEPEGGYRHVPPEEIADELAPATVVLGDARDAYPACFARFPGAAAAPVRPDVVARLALARFQKGERLRPQELRPLYLRRSDPEIRRGIG
jgi:tRNA threonylcarbamoyladenosine biosynthesis protein TsaB